MLYKMAQRIATLEAQIATLTHTVAQLSAVVASDHQSIIEKIKAVISSSTPAPSSTGTTSTSSTVPPLPTAVVPVLPRAVVPAPQGTHGIATARWCYASYQPQGIAALEPLVMSSSHQVGMGRDDHYIQVLQEGMYAIRLDGLIKYTGVSSLAELTIAVNEKVYETVTIPLLGHVGSSYGIVSASYLRHMQADDKLAVINGSTGITVDRLSISVTKY